MSDREHFALAALRLTGSESLFDDRLLASSGAHLRWSFRPELSFPPGGFDIYRGVPGGGRGEWIEHVGVPRSPEEAFGRIESDLRTPEVQAFYRLAADRLIEFLYEHLGRADAPPIAATSPSGVARVRALDMPLAASVDPFLARMLGLYWIDAGAPQPGSHVSTDTVSRSGSPRSFPGGGGAGGGAGLAYTVIGHWGGHEWPLREIDLSVASADLGGGELELEGLRLFAGTSDLTAISAAEDDLFGPYLRFRSEVAGMPLRLVFPEPVEEATVLVAGFEADGGWRATVDGRVGSVAVEAWDSRCSRLRIGAEGAFRRIELRGEARTWRLYGAGYRLGPSPVDDLIARATVPEPTPPVPILSLAEPEAAVAPPTLGADGRVGLARSEVELAVGRSGPPPDHATPAHPVRMHVQRSPGGRLTSLDGPVPLPLCRSPLPDRGPPGLLAEWSFDGDARDAHSESAPLLRGAVGFAPRHPDSTARQSLSLRGGGYLEAIGRPELQALGAAVTLDVWILPRPGRGYATIACNGGAGGVWLGLLALGEERHLVELRVNGEAMRAGRAVKAERWVRVTAVRDDSGAAMYLNGERVSERAELGAAAGEIAGGALLIGAAAGSTPESPRTAFSGLLADLRVWGAALHPDEADERVAAVGERPGGIGPPSHFVDRGLTDGDYDFSVQGVDLFGRTGEWSAPRRASIADRAPPTPPVAVRAHYLPLIGTVTGVLAGSAVSTDFALPVGLPADFLARGADGEQCGYDAELARPDPADAGKVRRQPFEIAAASADPHSGALTLNLRRPPLAKLRPRAGDSVRVELDARLELSWGLTGKQRLFYPRAKEFRIYRRRGPLNTHGGTVKRVRAGSGRGRFELESDLALPGPANSLAGGGCQIGGHRYALVSHEAGEDAELRIAYEAWPPLAPRVGDELRIPIPAESPAHVDFSQPAAWGEPVAVVPLRPGRVVAADARVDVEAVTPAERSRLRDAGVTWVPAEGLYRASFPTAEAVEPVAPAEFAAGALVARVEGAEREWRALTVLWHEPAADRGLDLYVADEEASLPSPLEQARYHPGERYRKAIETGVPASASGESTVQHELGVSVAVESGGQSGVAGPVSAIAVDRRRPPPPSQPAIVRFDRAGYDGRAAATVEWAPPASSRPLAFQLYRATDADVFARDLEQRRSLTGPYTSAQEAVADDADFTAWLPVIARRLERPGLAASWEDDLFAPRPAGLRPTAEWPVDGAEREALERAWAAWDKATPVWRAWSERFYPARDDAKVRELAECEGNHTAFALAHERPLRETRHVDHVPGAVRNRYLYRLRAQTPALLENAELGPASNPQAPPLARPPRAPAFSRVDAGDREIALRWTLNTEPDLKGYRLYRAEKASELDDLRHWGEPPDKRVVVDEELLPDPRLEVLGGRLLLPGEPPLGTVLAVYRADEFDPGRDPLDQPRAFDYRDSTPPATLGDGNVAIGLRGIAAGTPVVLVHRDPADKVRVLDRADPGALLLRIERRSLSLVDAVIAGEIAEILGVYALAEFDRTRDPLDEQDAENLFRVEPPGDTGAAPAEGEMSWYEEPSASLERLVPGSDGVAVAVVYRDRAGLLQVADRRSPSLRGEFRDRDLVGLRSYHYRLVAVNETGTPSAGSAIAHARPLELSTPPPPQVTVERKAAGDLDTVTLRIEAAAGLQTMIQHREAGGIAWMLATGWREGAPYSWEETVAPGVTTEYRVWSRTESKLTCEEPSTVAAEPA